MKVPFCDLTAQYLSMQHDIDKAVLEVLHSGYYILGTQVKKFESEFATFCDADFAIAVANGT